MNATEPLQFESLLIIKYKALKILYFRKTIRAYTEQEGIHIHLRLVFSDA